MSPCLACLVDEQSFQVCLTRLQDHQQTAQHFEGLLEPCHTVAWENRRIPTELKRGANVRQRLTSRNPYRLDSMEK